MKNALRVLEACAIAFTLAVGIGLLVWEWPRDPVLHYAELVLDPIDELAPEGRVMWAVGVERWNGSSLAAGLTDGLYVYGDEIMSYRSGEYSGHVTIRAPKGPTTEAADFWRDSDALLRYRLGSEGDLELIEIRGVDEASHRPFWIHSFARGPNRLRLVLETWDARAAAPRL